MNATVLIVLSLLAGDRGDRPEEPEISCAASCLWLLLQLEGRDVSVEEVSAALPASALGHCFAEIVDRADKLHLQLRPRTLRPGAPLPRRAFIAHLAGDNPSIGHFVVLRPFDRKAKRYQILDPPYYPRLVDVDEVDDHPRWTGHILEPADWPTRWTAGALLVTVGAAGLLRRRLLGWIGARVARAG